MSFSVVLFEVSSRLDSGFALLAEICRTRDIVFSAHHIWSHTMSVCPTAGDINFDYLVKVRSARSALCKVALSPFTDNNYLVE